LIYQELETKVSHHNQNQEMRLLQTNYLTINGHNFLIANDGLENKILIFETIDFLRKAGDGRNLFMDGTSKICPKLYTIHVIQDFGRTSSK
jgi:hypothetical protein